MGRVLRRIAIEFGLVELATAEEIAVLRGHEDVVLSAAFSPDGTRIVTASDDKTARICGAATAKEIVVLRSQKNLPPSGTCRSTSATKAGRNR